MSGGYWSRDNLTDLPDYTSNVDCSVANNGNLDAANVAITIAVNGQLYTNGKIPLIAMSSTSAYSFSVTTSYDAFGNVQIQAACQDSSDSYSLSIGRMFPRYWSDNPGILELLITPKEANLVNSRNSICATSSFSYQTG